MRKQAFILVLLVLLMPPNTISQTGSQQIHSRVVTIFWFMQNQGSQTVSFVLFANVEIWNSDNSPQNLIYPQDCSSKLETNIILNDSSLYEGIIDQCEEQSFIQTYDPGIEVDSFSVVIEFNDVTLTNLPDGSYDIWLPVNGGKAQATNFVMNGGEAVFTYPALLEGWGANENSATPSITRQPVLSENEIADAQVPSNTLTSTLIIGDFLKISFGIGVVAMLATGTFFARRWLQHQT